MKIMCFTLHFIRLTLAVEAVRGAGYLKNNGRKNRALKDNPKKKTKNIFSVMDSDYEIKLFI